MKKIKTLIIVSLLIVLPIISLRTCERSRMMSSLDAQARKLDALLDQEQHNGLDELAKALNSYLSKTSFAINNQGFLFGSYFSTKDKQILFANAHKRLMRVKTVLLTNPSFFNMELPDFDNVVNLFFEKLGTISYRNKDQVIKDILKRWADSGEMASLYLTKDDKSQQKTLASEWRAREEAKKWEHVMAVKKAQIVPETVIPGIENVQKMKQREVTRVTRLLIPFEKFDRYLGQKLNFILKNGRQMSGKCGGTYQNLIIIEFTSEGSPLVMEIPREEIAKIEKVTKEQVLEMYDPTMERETFLKPGFHELVYMPYPQNRAYVGFITIDNKMFFIDNATGALTCHSKENREGYKPLTTSIPENSLKDFHTSLYYPKLESKLNLVFELRLIKEVPGASSPIIISCKDLLLNPKTVRSIFFAQDIDSAIVGIGNPKYGKGELPWEYELSPR